MTDLVADESGERLDVFIARRLPELTRSRVKKLIEEGCVTVGRGQAKASMRLDRDDVVSVDVPAARDAIAQPEAIPIDVLYEDSDLLVVNKPAGMTVHPSPGHEAHTLVNAILAHCDDLSGIGGVMRPGIVHRLDRDTTGVILVAKNDATHNGLASQLKDRRVEKTYLALVEGTPTPLEGVIDAPIARDPRNRQKMAIVEGGRESVTGYRVVERFDGYALVEARPRTGRTHQIRVHLAAIGHPIAGDRVYGRGSRDFGRQLLHASRIAFEHPRTKERVEFEAALPADFAAAVDVLRNA